MEQAILLQNRHWEGKIYSSIFQRASLARLIEKLELKEIQVLQGIRRCGKSSIFRLLINHLSKTINPKKILFLNCEDPFFIELWSDASKFYKVIELAEKITGTPVEFLFLDEVQVIEHWEKFVKSSYEAERFRKIFITGSNSDLLEGDYIKMLSGRYLSETVYPLTFAETLSLQGIESIFDISSKKPAVLRLLDETLQNGFFPEVFKTKKRELKRDLLVNYFETIVLKDCLLNNKIRDPFLLRNLANYILTNVASIFSYNSLARAVGSNENTIKQYINTLQNSYIIKEVHHFSFSLKNQAKTKKKIYCIDNGLINAISLSFSSNHGKLLENLVFSEILKMGKFEIFFYNEQEECDFILKERNKLVAIQVVYDLNSRNEARELKGLEVVRTKFKITNAIIVTYNQEIDGEHFRALPFVKLIDYLNET